MKWELFTGASKRTGAVFLAAKAGALLRGGIGFGGRTRDTHYDGSSDGSDNY